MRSRRFLGKELIAYSSRIGHFLRSACAKRGVEHFWSLQARHLPRIKRRTYPRRENGWAKNTLDRKWEAVLGKWDWRGLAQPAENSYTIVNQTIMADKAENAITAASLTQVQIKTITQSRPLAEIIQDLSKRLPEHLLCSVPHKWFEAQKQAREKEAKECRKRHYPLDLLPYDVPHKYIPWYAFPCCGPHPNAKISVFQISQAVQSDLYIASIVKRSSSWSQLY